MHPPLAQAARTACAGCRVVAMSQRTLGSVAVHAWPCRRVLLAVSQGTLGCVAAHAWPCRSVRLAVSQCTPSSIVALSLCALAHHVAALLPSPSVTIQFLYRDSSPLPRAPCVVSRAHNVVSWRIVVPYHSLGALFRNPKSPPSATIQNLYHDLPLARPCTRRTVARPARMLII